MALRAALSSLISITSRNTQGATLRSMSGVVVDGFRTFELAMVQLGGIQDDKKANLAHAAAMIKIASQGNGKTKADLVMLPVYLAVEPADIYRRYSTHQCKAQRIILTRRSSRTSLEGRLSIFPSYRMRRRVLRYMYVTASNTNESLFLSRCCPLPPKNAASG